MGFSPVITFSFLILPQQANIRAKKRQEFKQQLLEKPVEESSESHFYDYRVLMKPFSRTKKCFKFHEQGKYIQLAQRERAKVSSGSFSLSL